jgi:hypothetical protein
MDSLDCTSHRDGRSTDQTFDNDIQPNKLTDEREHYDPNHWAKQLRFL